MINPLGVKRRKRQNSRKRWYETSELIPIVIMDRRLTGAFIGSAKNLMERRILMRKSRKRMGTGENRAEK
jgi:hypothetical protein